MKKPSRSNVHLSIALYLILFPVFARAQQTQEYDQYDCIVKKIVDSCEKKQQLYVNDVGKNEWQLFDEQRSKSNFHSILKDHLEKSEREILDREKGLMTTTIHFITYCNNPPDGFHPNVC